MESGNATLRDSKSSDESPQGENAQPWEPLVERTNAEEQGARGGLSRVPLRAPAIGKHQGRFPTLEERILAMHLRGLANLEIGKSLRVLEGVELRSEEIAAKIESLRSRVSAWRARRLDPCYIVVTFDSCEIQIRDAGPACPKFMHFALGVRPDGSKDILGLWIAEKRRHPDWLEIARTLLLRGVAEILIVVHGDPGNSFAQAFHESFPAATILRCVAQATRRSLAHVSASDRHALTGSVARICKAATLDDACRFVLAFSAEDLGCRYPDVVAFWLRELELMTPMFDLPGSVRRLFVGAGAVESLQAKLRRRGVRAPGCFLNDEAAYALITLAVRNATAEWHVDRKEWLEARSALSAHFLRDMDFS